MYLDREIERFVGRWWEKYQKEDPAEVFDRFIALWLVLLALARADENENTGRPCEQEMELLENFFGRNWEQIAGVLNTRAVELKQLANRRGEEHGNTIIDCSPRLRDRVRSFAANLREGRPLTQRDIHVFAAILSVARNNLFHGRKIYDSRADRELLTLLIPVVADVIAVAAPQLGGAGQPRTVSTEREPKRE